METHPYYLALLCHRLPGIQAKQLKAICAEEVITHALLRTVLTTDQYAVVKSPPLSLRTQIQHDVTWMGDHGAQLIRWGEEAYPPLLLEIPDPPPLLYVRGNLALLASPQLAIVGSRRPTRGGGEHAYAFAKALATAGWTITSGLALGIDANAHQGALAAQGKTIAVLGTGLDGVYPRQHRALYAQIAEQGLLVSEWPLGSQPLAGHFPRRNRIISGLSLGVLVVEAALKSGSLVTARMALEQNREVFAIPGSINNPMAKGCHFLIRQGATLVESVDDIQSELVGWCAPTNPNPQDNYDAIQRGEVKQHENPLLAQIGFEPMTLDEIVAVTGWPIHRLLTEITHQVIEGNLEEREGRYWRIR